MRRPLLLALAAFLTVTSAPVVSYAQRDPEAEQRKQEQDAAKKRKQKEEWGDSNAPLPALKNAGPCPFVKSLYDASRTIDSKIIPIYVSSRCPGRLCCAAGCIASACAADQRSR